MALGPDGPVGYATDVRIDEFDDPSTHRPQRITVTGRARDLDLRRHVGEAELQRLELIEVLPEGLALAHVSAGLVERRLRARLIARRGENAMKPKERARALRRVAASDRPRVPFILAGPSAPDSR